MNKLVISLILYLYFCFPIYGQEPSVLLELRRNDRDRSTILWEYIFKFSNFEPDEILTINISLPDNKDLVISIPDSKVVSENRARGEWKFKFSKPAPKNSFDVKIIVAGGKHRFKDEAIEWSVEVADTVVKKNLIVGPSTKIDPSLFRAMVGGGAGVLIDDQIDWITKDNHLLVENDSRTRASVLAGGLFYVKPFVEKITLSSLKTKSKLINELIKTVDFILLKPIRFLTDDILLSFEFSEGTSQTLDGFVFGLSKRISRYLNFVIGYSLRNGNELSPGFRRSANQIIQANKENDNTLDGLPLEDPNSENGDNFFPGDPIISSFNSAIHVGFVIPIDLKGFFTQGE